MTSAAFELDGPRTGRHALRGWDVVLAIAAGEAEVAFWLRHGTCLTPDERRALAAGQLGVIRRPLRPDWSEGDWVSVARNLDIRIEAVERRFKRGAEHYNSTFHIRDFRPNLPRRVPQVLEPPAFDQYGAPIPATPRAVEAARIDGSYTESAALAVPDIAEEVDIDTTQRYAEQARVNHSQMHAEQLAKREIRTVTQRLRRVQGEAARKGIDIGPDVRRLRDQVVAIERRVSEAA